MSPHPSFVRREFARARRAAVAADLRAGSIPDIQLVGGVGAYEVDVLVRVLPTAQVEIVGQVTHAGRIHEPVGGLAVVLYDAQAMEAAAQTRTNAFGEFDLHGDARARYALALGEERDAPCLLIWEGGSRVEACDAPV
jgi:hypothetical protein